MCCTWPAKRPRPSRAFARGAVVERELSCSSGRVSQSLEPDGGGATLRPMDLDGQTVLVLQEERLAELGAPAAIEDEPDAVDDDQRLGVLSAVVDDDEVVGEAGIGRERAELGLGLGGRGARERLRAEGAVVARGRWNGIDRDV